MSGERNACCPVKLGDDSAVEADSDTSTVISGYTG